MANYVVRNRRQWLQIGCLSWLVACSLTHIFSSTTGTKFLNAAEPEQTISLEIDYGDGTTKKFKAVAWKEGMTVLQAMQSAARHPRGIKIALQGNGEFTFVVAIDDLKNEGNGKNWLYRVNGKMADRSCAIRTIKPDDQILWEFSDNMP